MTHTFASPLAAATTTKQVCFFPLASEITVHCCEGDDATLTVTVTERDVFENENKDTVVHAARRRNRGQHRQCQSPSMRNACYREYVHDILRVQDKLRSRNVPKAKTEFTICKLSTSKTRRNQIDAWERARIDAYAARMIQKESAQAVNSVRLDTVGAKKKSLMKLLFQGFIRPRQVVPLLTDKALMDYNGGDAPLPQPFSCEVEA
jgi:hypothetical protein